MPEIEGKKRKKKITKIVAKQICNFLIFISQLPIPMDMLPMLARTSTVIVLETFRNFFFKLTAAICDMTTSEHKTGPIKLVASLDYICIC